MVTMSPFSESPFGDDELEGLVGETLAADREVPDGWREAARAAYAWRNVDEELLALTFDSEREPAAAVRGDDEARTLEFSGDGLTLEVELTGGRVLGQVTGAGEVVLEWADGRTASAIADGSGFFSLDTPLADGGPVRFCVRRGGARLVTEWVVP
ncbi:hypothetical protein GCM10027600_32290 [Nocardioides ginsengisegetis]